MSEKDQREEEAVDPDDEAATSLPERDAMSTIGMSNFPLGPMPPLPAGDAGADPSGAVPDISKEIPDPKVGS
ncbi:MAG: hypothetical protein E6H84_02665 [Chloroflexi bacterium]|nr:MAG: hypothetical protein E6H84_02665 [Chloroflexota bacterium]TMG70884.1 MAG: hypothetical protein E6H81_06070 [Chloroflexota bacterium]